MPFLIVSDLIFRWRVGVIKVAPGTYKGLLYAKKNVQ